MVDGESQSARAQKQRRRLLDRSAEVLAARPGCGMVELAGRIDASRATLYRYFPTREALVRELALDAIRAVDAACDGIYAGAPSYREAFRRTFDALIPLGPTHHFLAKERGLDTDADVRREVERQDAAMRAMVEEAQAAGEIASDLSARWVARHFDALVWTAWSEVRAGYLAPRDATRVTFRSFWGGVSTSSSTARD